MNDADMPAMWPDEDDQMRAEYEAAQTAEQKAIQDRVEQAIVSLILALGDLIRLGQDGGYGFQVEYRERKHIETALSDLACLCACLKIAPKIPAVS